MNNESETVWKEVVMTLFKVMSYLPGGTEENHENLVRIADCLASV
jgi:hypothetical protein